MGIVGRENEEEDKPRFEQEERTKEGENKENTWDQKQGICCQTARHKEAVIGKYAEVKKLISPDAKGK